MTDAQVGALVAETRKIADSEFTEYGGGWKGRIGTALVDAVFSIRAKYTAKDPTRGVIGRLVAFNEARPEAMDDLDALIELGEHELARIMGRGVTGGRKKAACVIEAAQNLRALDPPVTTAADLLGADPLQVKKAYTSVHGLSWVTCEYFQMLLGKPGVKADTMIVRFVNAALEASGLDPVDARSARELVVQASGVDVRGATLTHFEHALWRAKGQLVVDDPDPEESTASEV